MEDKKLVKEEKLIKIEILPEHVHENNGISFPAGSILEVDSSTARWLLDNKVGKLVQ